MTLFMLNFGQKMLGFQKMTAANFKIGKLFVSLKTSNF